LNTNTHSNTPQLAVVDNRHLPVRQVVYCRRNINEFTAEARVTVQRHDPVGRLVTQRDPRFLEPVGRPNLSTVYSLSGAVFCVDSVNAGRRRVAH
jgi:insecticidal toxin complex protein TccC